MTNTDGSNPKLLLIAAACGFALVAFACTPQATDQTEEVVEEPVVEAPPPIDDATITAELEGSLKADPAVSLYVIEVASFDGAVTLTGQVESEEAKATAESLALVTAGVEAVDNQIEVVPPGKAKGKITDAWITTKVKSKLAADPQVNPFNINVDTKDRVVTLSGEVESDVARAEAEKHARDTKGVTAVVNEVTVAVEDTDEAAG